MQMIVHQPAVMINFGAQIFCQQVCAPELKKVKGRILIFL